ncbi:MAG: hypothetical protein ACOC22_01865 [bacterium]
MKKEKNRDIWYYHSPEYSHFENVPRVTAAGEFDKDEKTLRVGLSIANPKFPFSKKRGRYQSTTRLVSGDHSMIFRMEKCTPKKFREMMDLMFGEVRIGTIHLSKYFDFKIKFTGEEEIDQFKV